MKKAISLLILTIMLVTSVPMSLYISAGAMLTRDNERAISEYLYYSDIFYTYPYYLKNNDYLNRYQATTSGVISNVLAEYVTTSHFGLSVASQVLGKATSAGDVVKYVQSNMNYQDFVFENELDMANRLMLQALSENDAQKAAVDFTKNSSEQIKNFSSLTKLATTLEETTDALEDAGHMSDDIDVYEGLLEVTFEFLGKNAPRLASKLPEINDGLEANLGKSFEVVSAAADASEFAAALAVTVMAQEAQLELIYDILNDAPKDSMLYAGMTRLKNQLESGAVTFFKETYLEEAVFKKVIDKFTEGIIKAISGGFPPIQVVSIVTAVIDVVNAVIFKWILGANYDNCISAVLLASYKESLAATLDNMSDRYASYFISDDIVAYSNVFNAYITVNKAAYEFYCKLSTYNDTYNSTYTASYSSVYEDMSYEKYISEVKAYILFIPEEIREKTNHGTWTLNGNVTLMEPTDEIALGYCYMPKNFKGNITVSNGSLTIAEGDSFTINGNLTLNGNSATLNNDGTLTVTDSVIMGNNGSNYVYNNGTMTVSSLTMNGRYAGYNVYYLQRFYNNGDLTVTGDIIMEGSEPSYFYMNNDTAVLRVGGNIMGYNVNSFPTPKGNIILCGNEQQTVKCLSAYDITIENNAGVKYLSDTVVYGRYDPCGNPIDTNGCTTRLEGSASLAPDNNYGNVNINCDFTVEGDLTADLTVTGNSKTITVPEGKVIELNGYIYLYAANTKLYNDGNLKVTDYITMGNKDTSTYVYNNGTMTVSSLTMRARYGGYNVYYQQRFYNNGDLTVTGDILMEGSGPSYFYMNEDDAVLRVGGNVTGYNVNSFPSPKGSIILCGTELQSVKGFSAYNLTVINNKGIKYLSDTVIYGRYDLCGNTLDRNGYTTKLEGSATLAPDNNYGNVHLNCDLTVEGDLTADFTVTASSKKITIPEDKEIVLDGFIYLYAGDSKLYNNGKLTVTKYITMGNETTTYVYNNGTMSLSSLTMNSRYLGYGNTRSAYFYNNGKLDIAGDILMEGTHASYFYMNQDDSVLRVGGNVSGNSTGGFPNPKGSIILCGTEQQSVKGFSAYNLTVENKEGIKYLSDITVYGKYDLCGNTLDNNGYTTHIGEGGYIVPGNDFKKIYVSTPITIDGDIKGDIVVTGSNSITIPEGADVTIDGNIYLSGTGSKLYNNGALTVTGSFSMGNQNDTYAYNNGVMSVAGLVMDGKYISTGVYRSARFYNNGELTVNGDIVMKGYAPSYLYMNADDAVLRVGGNIDGYSSESFPSSKGTVILCGSEQQTVEALSANNLTVTNQKGIKYLSHTTVTGRYDLCGNPLESGGYYTILWDNASLAPGAYYGDIRLNCDLTIEEGYLAGNITTTTNGVKITVAEGTEAVFDGLICLYNTSTITNDGNLTVTDSIVMGSRNYDAYVYNNGVMTVARLEMNGQYLSYGSYKRGYFYNNGTLTVKGDIIMQGSAPSCLYMKDESLLRVGGNVSGYTSESFPDAKGKIIFNGNAKQTVTNLTRANIVEIDNQSYEGIVFMSNLNYTTLFNHKGNRFTGSVSNIDYDGDGMYDRYDPKPTVGEKASVITRDYDVTVGHAGEIKHIRYASGIHETASSIKNASDRVDIDASVIAANTLNNVYTRNMPDGGVYTFHIKLNDGTEFLRTADMSRMKQRVSVDGVRITTHNLYGVRDYFIAEGDYNSYNEIKADGYIVRLTDEKMGAKHDYTYTVSNPGRHTVLVRYKDSTRPDEVFKVDLEVVEPTLTVNGLQVTVGNIPGVKVIRTAYGEYNTPGDTKRAAGARNFSNKSVIKDASEYRIQYREEGMITIVVEYDNGYVKVFHHELVQKNPTFEQNGNTVTFGDLDGLVMVRYAKGEYKTSSEIKKATGSKAIKPEAVVDGKINVTLEPGIYTFCIQYDDDSYNYYKVIIE